MDTKEKVLFLEVQGASKKSALKSLWVVAVLFALALLFNLIRQNGTINEITGALFVGLLIFIIAAVFTDSKLVTEIREDGIYVRFPPFQPSFARFGWEEIEEVYLRNYDAVSEYYGWGIKIGLSGKGYITAGEIGIQIILKNGEKILVTTRRSEEVANVLGGLGK